MVTIKTKGMRAKKCEFVLIAALKEEGITATADYKTNLITIERGTADIKKAKQIVRSKGY
jgi:hypothetical protein